MNQMECLYLIKAIYANEIDDQMKMNMATKCLPTNIALCI